MRLKNLYLASLLTIATACGAQEEEHTPAPKVEEPVVYVAPEEVKVRPAPEVRMVAVSNKMGRLYSEETAIGVEVESSIPFDDKHTYVTVISMVEGATPPEACTLDNVTARPILNFTEVIEGLKRETTYSLRACVLDLESGTASKGITKTFVTGSR